MGCPSWGGGQECHGNVVGSMTVANAARLNCLAFITWTVVMTFLPRCLRVGRILTLIRLTRNGSEMAVGCRGSLFGQRKENGTVGRRQETLKSLLGMTEMPRELSWWGGGARVPAFGTASHTAMTAATTQGKDMHLLLVSNKVHCEFLVCQSDGDAAAESTRSYCLSQR